MANRGYSLGAVHRFLTAVASRLFSWLQSSTASVVVVLGLTCPVACGILPDRGSNLCPLHWQTDASPLGHQGSPQRMCLDVARGLYAVEGIGGSSSGRQSWSSVLRSRKAGSREGSGSGWWDSMKEAGKLGEHLGDTSWPAVTRAPSPQREA